MLMFAICRSLSEAAFVPWMQEFIPRDVRGRIRNRTITAYVDKNEFLEILDIPSDETIHWFLIEKNSKDILARGYGIIAEKDLEIINSY